MAGLRNQTQCLPKATSVGQLAFFVGMVFIGGQLAPQMGVDAYHVVLPQITTTSVVLADMGSSQDWQKSDSEEDEEALAHNTLQQTLLEQWQQYPKFNVGMRMAQLSEFWISNGLPCLNFVVLLVGRMRSSHPPQAFRCV
jgi:hypothetical protein